MTHTALNIGGRSRAKMPVWQRTLRLAATGQMPTYLAVEVVLLSEMKQFVEICHNAKRFG